MFVMLVQLVCRFHVIEDAEGRNDAFSAIFTRMKKAPDVIVYDFACSLEVERVL